MSVSLLQGTELFQAIQNKLQVQDNFKGETPQGDSVDHPQKPLSDRLFEIMSQKQIEISQFELNFQEALEQIYREDLPKCEEVGISLLNEKLASSLKKDPSSLMGPSTLKQITFIALLAIGFWIWLNLENKSS